MQVIKYNDQSCVHVLFRKTCALPGAKDSYYWCFQNLFHHMLNSAQQLWKLLLGLQLNVLLKFQLWAVASLLKVKLYLTSALRLKSLYQVKKGNVPVVFQEATFHNICTAHCHRQIQLLTVACGDPQIRTSAPHGLMWRLFWWDWSSVGWPLLLFASWSGTSVKANARATSAVPGKWEGSCTLSP